MQTVKSMGFLIFSAIIATGLIFSSATTADATLMSRDLNAPGDGFITFDSDTGLEWLDLPLTLDMTLAQILASAFVLNDGFGTANVSQVSNLFTNAGATDLTETFLASQFDAAELLVGLLGETGDSSSTFSSQGFARNAPDNGFFSTPFVEHLIRNSGRFGLPAININPVASPTAGYFLIRTASPVPEPSSLPLLLGALIGLGFMRRYRQCEKRT